MQNVVVSRFAALILVTATVFGAVSPALAAPGVPVNLDIVGGKYTNDTTPTFTWTPGASATWYEVLLDNGSWISVGNESTYTLWSLPNGWHTFYVRSHDNGGEVSTSAAVTFEIDTVGPNVSEASPITAKTNVPVMFTVVAGSSDVMATYCMLNINGYTYDMNAQFSSDARARNFTLSHTFDRAGSFGVGAKCKDGDGNYTTGPVRTVVVSKGVAIDNLPPAPVIHTSVPAGTVVIAACGAHAGAGDSCHTVYYVGNDGKKHSFPSESVYFTWFSSYANMVTVTKSTLASIPTGGAVTYRPGTVLVKFPNSTTVYAVADGQVLRPIMNEAAAKAIYGSKWNDYVVTISESYTSNYTIGSKIYSSGDYSKSQEYYGTKTIDQNWK